MKILEKYWYLIPVILFIVLVTHKYGPGINVDGVFYLLSGKALASKGDFFHFDNIIPGWWPPLYSVTIALLKLTGINLMREIEILNILLFSGTLILSYFTIIQFITNKKLVFYFMVTLLISFPIFNIFNKVESEGTFIFFITALIFVTIKLVKSFKAKNIIWLIVIMTLLQLQRYPGVYCNFLAIFYLILTHRKNSRIIKSIFLVGIMGFLPIGLWVIRNYYIIDRPIGLYPDLALSRICFFGYNSMNEWILPRLLPVVLRNFIFYGLLLICFAIIIRHRKIFKDIMFLPGFFLGYSLAITLLIPINIIEGRFLSPAFIPFVVTIFVVWDRINFKSMKLLVTFSVICLTINQLITTSLFVSLRFRTGGGGYNTDAWQISPLSVRLKTKHLQGDVYTNEIGPCEYFNDGYAYNIQDKDLANCFKAFQKGYLVLYKYPDRDITGIKFFESRLTNNLIQKALRDTLSIYQKNADISRTELLTILSKRYHIVYSAPEVFADGFIYPMRLKD